MKISFTSTAPAKIVLTSADPLNYAKVGQLIKKNGNWDFKDNILQIEQEKLGVKWLNEIQQTLRFLA